MGSREQQTRHTTKGAAFSLIGCILLASNFVTAKYSMAEGGFNPVFFGAVWFSAASCYALMIVLISGRRTRLRLPRESVPHVIGIGLLTGVGMIFGWTSVQLLNAAFAGFLWRFTPVMTIMFGMVLMKEKLRPLEAGPILAMVAGGAVSAYADWEVVGRGVILALLACTFTAAQFIIAKVKAPVLGTPVLNFYRNAVGAATIWVWALLTGRVAFDPGPSHWATALGGAFLGPCAGVMMIYHSYRYWEMSRTAVVSTLQPIFLMPMTYLFLGQFLSQTQLLGGMIILAGALALAWIHRYRAYEIVRVGDPAARARASTNADPEVPPESAEDPAERSPPA